MNSFKLSHHNDTRRVAMNNKIEDKATEVKDTTVNAATQAKDAFSLQRLTILKML